MCDVAGHGIGPSLLASRVSSGIRRFIMDCLPPMEILRSLNKFIFEHFREAHLFLSFMAVQIDLDGRTVTYSGAGHPAALLVRAEAGKVQGLRSQNMVIGVKEDCLSGSPEHQHTLAAGDRLLFYADGLTQTRNRQGRQLGSNRLSQIAAAAMSVEAFAMADRILENVASFRHGPPTDDITLIVAELN